MSYRTSIDGPDVPPADNCAATVRAQNNFVDAYGLALRSLSDDFRHALRVGGRLCSAWECWDLLEFISFHSEAETIFARCDVVECCSANATTRASTIHDGWVDLCRFQHQTLEPLTRKLTKPPSLACPPSLAALPSISDNKKELDHDRVIFYGERPKAHMLRWTDVPDQLLQALHRFCARIPLTELISSCLRTRCFG